MTWINYDDVVSQLVEAGFQLDGGIDVGARKRVKVSDLTQKGWYAAHEIKLDDGRPALVGAYGWWIGAEKFVYNLKLRVEGKSPAMSADQMAAVKKRIADEKRRAEAERKASAERAALAAGRAWRAYVADGSSDYLERKNVRAHGLRFAPSGAGTVAVPMMDAAGKVWGLQLIRGKDRAKGKLEKQYWPKGVAVQGHWHLLGPIPKDLLLLAEGYATAATLHQATGLPVAVAFDAGNLRPVAEAIKKTYRRVRILVCADDDYLTEGNPGVKAAEAAAFAVDGAIAVPQFAADRAGKKITDYNDLAHAEGEPVVRAQIEARLLELGWADSATRAAGNAQQGGGEASGNRRDDLAAVIQVDEALDRFAMIYGAGGTWFDGAEHMLVPKSDLQDILPEHGMRDMRNRKRVVRLDEVGFDPAGTDPRIKCNLWGGWPTTPRAGTCSVLLELLEYLCSAEENPRETFQWVLRWLAYPIQNPGAKMRTALVFHGPQGTGKNLFFETVMAIYGDYGRIVDQSAVEDKFNDWASRKLFMIADEVVARAELFHVKNKLKGLVTGEWIRINPKNVAAHDEKNHVNLVFLSNERQPIVLEKDDRRYAVIWTPEKLPQTFYADVKAELKAGGREALHHALLNVAMGDFDEYTLPPSTAAKRDVIEISMDSVERFVADWRDGEVSVEGGDVVPFRPCLGSHLYTIYLRWCKENGVFRPRERGQFIGTLAKLRGWTAGKPIHTRHSLLSSAAAKTRKMVVPDAETIKSSPVGVGRDGDRIVENYWREEGEDQATWLTRSFFGFCQAVGVAP